MKAVSATAWQQMVPRLGLAVALACGLTGLHAQTAGDSTAGGQRVEPLPSVDLTSDMVLQLLASEVAADQGQADTAAAALITLAQRTRDPRVARRAAELALQAGDLDRALTAATLWSQIEPGSVEARQSLLALSAALGRTVDLGASLRERIRAALDKPGAINQAQRTVARMPDKQAALKVLDEALTDVRALPEARLAMARTALDAEQAERALTEARAAVAARDDWELAALVALQAGLQLDAGVALTDAARWLSRNPAAMEMRMALIRAHAQRREWDQALARIDEAPDVARNMDLQYARGIVRYQAGDLDAADAALRNYLTELRQRQAARDRSALNRETTPALLMLAQIAEDRKQWVRAMAWLNQVNESDEIFPARLRAALLERHIGGVAQARAALARLAVSNDEQRVQRVLAESRLLRDDGQVSEAIAVVRQAVDQLPQQPDLMYDAALMLANSDGPMEEIERLLRKVIELRPDYAHAYNALGYTLADRNLRLPEAKALIERALNLAPEDAYIIDSMGWVEYRMGNLPAARRYLERAWSIKPDAEIGAHLGEVLWKVGDQTRAREFWRAARDKDPDNATLRNTLRRFGVEL